MGFAESRMACSWAGLFLPQRTQRPQRALQLPKAYPKAPAVEVPSAASASSAVKDGGCNPWDAEAAGLRPVRPPAPGGQCLSEPHLVPVSCPGYITVGPDQ